MKEIVVSSFAFAGTPAEEIIRIAQENKFPLEFSSGMPYRADMEKIFLGAQVERFAHNYFPAPEIPFVLNLGSADAGIRNRSIEHCVHGIELSHKAGAPFFSAHAGMCVDPSPSELGRELNKVRSFDREMHWKYFVSSVKEVLQRTNAYSEMFLLENNVMAKMNVYADGSNPAFCADAGEMLQLIREVDHPRVGILLDTAHLKVSANTFGFDAVEHARKILPFTKCIHHSDNDGNYDTNEPFGTDYWFLPLMKEADSQVHVIEVRKQPVSVVKELISLLSRK